MSFYSAYDYFDLQLSNIMQQRSNLAKESFLHGLYVIDLRKIVNAQLKRELKFYLNSKEKIQKLKAEIRDLKKKMSTPKKYIVKRKLKLLIGDGAVILAKICAGILDINKNKKLKNVIESKRRTLRQCEYPAMWYRPDYGDRIKSSITKEDVLIAAMTYLDSEYNKRVSTLKTMFPLKKEKCQACRQFGDVVKIECGHSYHIDCLNDIVTTQIIEEKMQKASCIKCEVEAQY